MTARLDIDAMRVLCAIADHGGVTRAAEHLPLSQSAVSHKIRRLESQIGCRLLTRRPGAPLFSADGTRLLGYARRMLALHDEALQSLSKQPLSGHIRLGMTEDVTSSDLSRLLGRFSRLYPRVQVRTHVRQSLVLQEELAEGGLDLAIMQVFSQAVKDTDLVLLTERVHWVKAHDMELPETRPIPFLAYDDRCFYYDWARGLQAPVLTTVLQCASSAGIASAVRAGLGVALLPERYVSAEMQILKGGFPKVPEITYVLRAAAKARSAPIRALSQEIERGAQQDSEMQLPSQA